MQLSWFAQVLDRFQEINFIKLWDFQSVVKTAVEKFSTNRLMDESFDLL